jgi:cysteine desulfurase family protein
MIYLDNAATSHPKPEEVYRAVDRTLRSVGGNPGRGSHRMALEASRAVFDARETLAKLLGAPDAGRIVFTKNATEGINIALKGLLQPGDHVVTTSFEHNSVARTLRKLEIGGISVTRVSGATPGIVTPHEVETALTDMTRLVVMTHASNVFGAILPIDEIGRVVRSRGALFMTDAAQTAGALPMDIGESEVDIVAGTGHKALYGPQGIGFLYLREGVEPRALIDGGTGEFDDALDIPDRLETGTVNTPGIAGLGAGARYVLDRGVDAIRSREEAHIRALIDGLGRMGRVRIIGPTDARERVSLVSFAIDRMDAREAGRRLDEDYGIMVRCGAHCAIDAHKTAGTHPAGAIRVSPGYFTTPEEIAAFLKAVREISG